MYIGIDLSIEEYTKDFEKLGYTHDEAIELAKLATQTDVICPDIDFDEFNKIVEKFNNIPEVYPIRTEDLKKALERYKNESA